MGNKDRKYVRFKNVYSLKSHDDYCELGNGTRHMLQDTAFANMLNQIKSNQRFSNGIPYGGEERARQENGIHFLPAGDVSFYFDVSKERTKQYFRGRILTCYQYL